jgi:Na+-transporting NADH:ubiquinone oxidoreductase subunit NqrD
MKKNNEYHYSGITSFEDLRLERSRLILKSKLIETKIQIDILQTREVFSISALVLSLVRKYIPPDIFGIVEAIFNK